MICTGTRYVPRSDRALFSPCPSRLLLSVRVHMLKEYENLHVHFKDCVGRRVTNASGAFLEHAPSSGSSSEMPSALLCSSIYTYRYVSSVVPLPYAWNTVFCSTDRIQTHIYQTLGIMSYLHPLATKSLTCIR